MLRKYILLYGAILRDVQAEFVHPYQKNPGSERHRSSCRDLGKQEEHTHDQEWITDTGEQN